MAKRSNIDMISGPLLSNVIRYTIPIILTGLLQLLFNAADLIVIGCFRGSESVGAVGATGSISNLLVNVFIGLSTGISVVTANAIGARDSEGVRRTVHTAMPIALIGGAVLSVIGVTLAEPLLRLMDTPASILPKSVLYMQIYFAGILFNLVYNFGAAILRAAGNTKSPLIYLTIAGVTNVILNIVFVTIFSMDVEGVAIATVVSQAISSVLVIIKLMRTDADWRFIPRKMRINMRALQKIAYIGLPAGIQGSVFSISNVLIQSSVNSFGASAVSGNAAAGNIEGFIYVTMNAFYQTTLNFTGQNIGAGNINRIGKIVRTNMLTMFAVSVVLSNLAYMFAPQLLSIYITDDPSAIQIGVTRMTYICLPYFLCGIMEVLVGAVRGTGASLAPMLISILGVCGIRIVWILTVFKAPAFHSLDSLYFSYIISWLACIIGYIIYLNIRLRHFKNKILKS